VRILRGKKNFVALRVNGDLPSKLVFNLIDVGGRILLVSLSFFASSIFFMVQEVF
jgi:hypothetical protein